MHKNILIAIGITFLFLGLAIQPSVAVTPNNSDVEDDCDICPSINKKINWEFTYICNFLISYLIRYNKIIWDLMDWCEKLYAYNIFPILRNILDWIIIIKTGIAWLVIILLDIFGCNKLCLSTINFDNYIYMNINRG